MAQLRHQYAAIRAAGADLLAVTFETPAYTREYAHREATPFPFALDPARDLYHAYGLSRGSLRQIVNPATLARGLQATLRHPGAIGPQLRAAGHDGLQLGGDFVIGPDGLLLDAHAALHAGDAIAPAALMDLLTGSGAPQPAR